jgi:hypothetical protein
VVHLWKNLCKRYYWCVKSWVIPSTENDSAWAAFVCQMEQVLNVYARPETSAWAMVP